MIDTKFSRKLLGFCKFNLSICLKVALIAYYNDGKAFVANLAELLHPVHHSLERVYVSDIIHDERSLGISVVDLV